MINMEKLKQNIKKTYACSFPGCSSLFNRPYRLAQHQLVHENIKSFACTELNCKKVYTNKSHLDRHINSSHNQIEVDVVYSCPKCLKKYANRQNLKRHIKVSHAEQTKAFICELCDLNFKKKHQLRAHMFIHNGIKTFRCLHCDKEFVSLYDKKKHMRNHKTYCCENCKENFSRWTDLMSHKRKNHQLPEYICHDCGKVFKERQHIVRHIKNHVPNAIPKTFYCYYENCQRHYSRNSNLKQHILIKHEGLAFPCKICGDKLSTKAKLTEHTKRHTQSEIVKARKPQNSRKKRKDYNALKTLSASKLAGIQEIPKTLRETIIPSENQVVSEETFTSNETVVIGNTEQCIPFNCNREIISSHFIESEGSSVNCNNNSFKTSIICTEAVIQNC